MPDSSPIIEPIRDALRTAVDNGFSMTSLAEATGIPRPVLHRFCFAERHTLSADNLQRLAEHFGMRMTKPRRGLKPPH